MQSHSQMSLLNSPDRHVEISRLLHRKSFLRKFYEETYAQYRACANRALAAAPGGVLLELGSGVGFAKEIIPEMVTSDVIDYPTIDRVVDACAMPFESQSLSAIFLFNVFHHIPDVERFFLECQRCLKPGGRLFIRDQYPGWFAEKIYRYAHHEPYDDRVGSWAFESNGPLSDANGALAWIVFFRDRALFERKLPQLKIDVIQPHSPFRYWISGGLKKWTLVPGWSFPFWTRVDQMMAGFSLSNCSFVDIELFKAPESIAHR